MNLESISYGTILQFGDTAQVRICHLRTFCYKFAMALLTADEYFYYYKSTVSRLVSVKRIGVIGNVIKSGIIMPNDIVRMVYEPSDHIALQCAF